MQNSESAKKVLVASMLMLSALGSLAQAAEIDDGFRSPPKTCSLQTWWHWIDDCVTREGISRDLKAMSDAGISTAFVFSPKTWTMQPMVETMSQEWLDLFAFAIAEAKKNGIELGFHNCPGWSSSGGPWIAPEDSMKCLVSSSLDIRLGDLGGQASLVLPDPPQKLGFYHDVRLYAFPVKLPPRLVSGETPSVLPLKEQDSVECVLEYAEPFAPSVAAVDIAVVDFCMAVDVFADEGAGWVRRGGREFKLYRSQDLPRVVPLDDGAPARRWKFVFSHIENPAWIPRRDLSVRSVTIGDWPYEGARTSLKQADIVDLGNVVHDGKVSASLLAERLSGGVSKTWRIVRAGYTTTATPPAPATIAGLECDKLDRRGLSKHWKNMPARILSLPGARDVVKYVVIDSYEVGKQTWTESLPDEFLRRTGHEIWSALPALLGYRIASAEGAANAAEVDKVIADLYAENYYDYFAELCHAAGVKSVTEPYGGPFDPLRCGKMTDVPTCEFWIGKPLSYSVEKAVSIARTHGKNIVAAESFTTNAREGRWQVTPAELRRVGDNAWMAGVNQFVYHSYVHQPYVDRAPGCSLGPHGTQLNVNTTWWPQMRVWSDYVARGQFLLQYGHIVKDRYEIVPGKVEALVREGDGGERIWFVRNKSDTAVRETLALDCATRLDICEFDAVEGRIYNVECTPIGVVASLAPGETRFYVFAKDVKGEARAVPGELLEDLSHGWKIATFSGLAAPGGPVVAEDLFDWSKSTDERLRFFSGAADYVREGAFPAGILDLGDVRNVAEVRVDGMLVGTLAYSPCRIEIPAGKRLDVKVVNTWPNRLIGDAGRREHGEKPVTWSNWAKPWGADEELLPAGLLGPVKLYRRDFDIRGFGAVGDGKTLDTSAIQKAIDDCAARGGGRVVVAGGTYVTGTVALKSGVELHLAKDGVLMGSPDWRDWKDQPDAKHIDTYMCPRHRSAALVFADEAEDIAITGPGTIHGNGMAFVEKDPASKSGQLRRRLGLDKSPPRLVLFAGCRRVKVEGVNVLYPPAGWSFWVHDCDEALFSRVKIFADVDFPNADGIHVNCSRDVKISGCDIETGDDCIVVRANSASLKENRPCERVSVDNCRLRSYSCAVRVGWTNDGVMRDCSFSNLKVRDSVCGIGFFFPAGGDREKLSDQGREASVVENMTFTDIEMDGICARPVYVEISPHETTHVEKIRNVRFVNVSSRGLMLPVVSAPRPGIVSDIFFENCRFEIDPAGKSAYRNGGDVGFARVQRFDDREHGKNVANMSTDGGLALSADVAERHQTIARRAASESMVLLENNGALPLAKGSAVALFGEWRDYKTGGGGSSRVKPSRAIGFAEGLAEAGFTVDGESRETAIYVMYRAASENSDMPRESYAVSEWEQSDLAALREQGFRRIVLVINGGLLPNVRALYDKNLVDAILFTWYPGQEGCAAIGDILCGAVNPSGRLAATIAETRLDFPSDRTFMASPDYVPYEEDIYVGYRYFETIPGAKGKVAYPFGHGLSYTMWEASEEGCGMRDEKIEVKVKVTNTGNVAGKRSVLCYTSQSGGLADHPAMELRAFAKTRLLLPGESEMVVLSFDKNDLASFDDEGWSGRPGSWVIDRGRYSILVGGSVRDTVEVGSFDVPDATILSTPGIKSRPDVLARRLRADGSDSEREVKYCGKDGIEWRGKDDYPKETHGELTLFDVASGKTTMDAFLDQFSLADLLKLTHGHPAVAKGGTGSIGGGLEKYGILGAQTCDGPCGVRRELPSTAFPCAALIACSFDKALAHDIGRVIGVEAADVDFDLLLAPGLCIQRHPLCGRNFEYFSEDPYLSGAMASAYVKGVQSTGIGATLKHFCCNNRETNRRLASAVVSERALREIYLRGFERAVKEAKPWAIMTSYNHVNGLAASAHPGLLKGILRDEWGFDGVTMSDWFTSQPMWREIDSGNDVKMSHDLDLFTDRSTWCTGLGERNALQAYTCEYAAYVYLYRKCVRDSARRVCELVMKSRRFIKKQGE